VLTFDKFCVCAGAQTVIAKKIKENIWSVAKKAVPL
jgi:hypothetical protein